MDVSLLPDFRLGFWQLAALTSLPLLAGLIAALTAGKTVYNVLARLP